MVEHTYAEDMAKEPNLKTAVLAGGCFWCMEKPFEGIEGVQAVISGYTGGKTLNPTYEAVSRGDTGHYEAVKITYDANLIDYETLLGVFWQQIDPFDAYGQFCDKGEQYRAAVFYENEEEKALAEASKAEMQEALGQKIVTEVLPRKEFYVAEEKHQNFYKKNVLHYKIYRSNCGRDDRLLDVWGDE